MIRSGMGAVCMGEWEGLGAVVSEVWAAVAGAVSQGRGVLQFGMPGPALAVGGPDVADRAAGGGSVAGQQPQEHRSPSSRNDRLPPLDSQLIKRNN